LIGEQQIGPEALQPEIASGGQAMSIGLLFRERTPGGAIDPCGWSRRWRIGRRLAPTLKRNGFGKISATRVDA